MCDKEKRKLKDSYDTPLFGTLAAGSPIPKNKIREQPLEPALAYRLIMDELMNEGNARLNLATFCQTYMEDEAIRLMSETLEKMPLTKRNTRRQPRLSSAAYGLYRTYGMLRKQTLQSAHLK